jgi:hypothetical protein
MVYSDIIIFIFIFSSVVFLLWKLVAFLAWKLETRLFFTSIGSYLRKKDLPKSPDEKKSKQKEGEK